MLNLNLYLKRLIYANNPLEFFKELASYSAFLQSRLRYALQKNVDKK